MIYGENRSVKRLQCTVFIYVYFFIKMTARQQKQLKEHKALYWSINSFSEQIAGTARNLSPLAVLKTAILLHQRQL